MISALLKLNHNFGGELKVMPNENLNQLPLVFEKL
jgi:hypothetical protein